MDRTKYDAPTCAECGDEITGQHTEYHTGESPTLVTTSDPCGCVAEFPMPTRENNLAAAEINTMDQALAIRDPRDYLILAALAVVVIVIYLGVALIRDDVLFLGAAFIGVGMAYQNGKAWRIHRAYRSSVSRLVAK